MPTHGGLRAGMAARLGLPNAAGRRRLLAATAVDSLGSGLFLPFAVVYFVETTSLSLTTVGAALSLAAVLALPLPPLFGPLVDRAGPRAVVVAGNLVSATGFGCYLLVEQTWHIVAASVLVQIGTAMFWTSSGALVALAADTGQRARWFGLIQALRNAGIGLGGVAAAAMLAAGGQGGYQILAAGNAISYLLAAGLMLAWKATPEVSAAAETVARQPGISGYREVLRNAPFMVLVVINVFFVLSAMVLNVLLAVYITGSLGAPAWAAGALLAVNTTMIATGQTMVARRIEARDRIRVIRLGAILYGVSFVSFAGLTQAPPGLLIGGLVASTVIFTLAEMTESTAMSELVVSLAPPDLRGRYQAAFQLSWSVGIAAAPALFTWLLAITPTLPWIVLLLAAIGAATALSVLHRRLSPPVSDTAETSQFR